MLWVRVTTVVGAAWVVTVIVDGPDVDATNVTLAAPVPSVVAFTRVVPWPGVVIANVTGAVAGPPVRLIVPVRLMGSGDGATANAAAIYSPSSGTSTYGWPDTSASAVPTSFGFNSVTVTVIGPDAFGTTT